MKALHIEAVERILSAIYSQGDTLLSSFMFGRPGAPAWDRRLGTEIFVRRKEFTRALLFVRQNGAPDLRAISISDLWSMVTTFITENFWYICAGEFSRRSDQSYASQIDPTNKVALATALAASPLFKPVATLTLYPIQSIRVTDKFESRRFFLLNAADLTTDQLPKGIRENDLDPARFPPFIRWEGPRPTTTTWLGVRASTLQVSDKLAAAILGAVALTPLPAYRYMFSGRKVFGGRCTITDTCSVSGRDEPHTPPMMSDIVLTQMDHPWLTRLEGLLETTDRHSRSQVRALEYFYRAWFLDPRERFPWLCMALDSLVGVSNGHTSAAVKFVKNAIGTAVEDDRLRLLMRVRGAVIHGAAPDVYDSENYEQYYVDYGADPIRDLELVVAKCLRETVFAATLKVHEDPNAEIVAELKAKGRLPERLDEGRIIPETI